MGEFHKKMWDWLGHLGTSLLIGALFLGVFQWIPEIPLFVLAYIGIALIFHQLIHRVRLLG